MQNIKKMFTGYVDISEIPEATLLVFENHVETLIKRMQDDEQYTEKVVEFEVSEKAQALTDKITTYLEETYGAKITPFEKSMLLLHIGVMLDRN